MLTGCGAIPSQDMVSAQMKNPFSEKQGAPRGATAKLEAIANALRPGETLTLGELFARMEERAYGLLLLVLALPCCLPFIYVLPQIVALPMLFLAGQLAMGRASPWLPQKLAQRGFEADTLRQVVRRAKPWLGIVEWFAHPRLGFVTGPTAMRIIGALLLIPTASILLPLPLTNTVPGIAVVIVAIGLVERDGLLVAGGLVLGLGWVAALVIGGQAAIMLLTDFVRGVIAQ